MGLSANFQLTGLSGSPSVEYGTFYCTFKMYSVNLHDK